MLHPKPAKSRDRSRGCICAPLLRTGGQEFRRKHTRCRKQNKNRQAQKLMSCRILIFMLFATAIAAHFLPFMPLNGLFVCFVAVPMFFIHAAPCCLLLPLFLRTLRFMPHEIIIAQAMQKVYALRGILRTQSFLMYRFEPNCKYFFR